MSDQSQVQWRVTAMEDYLAWYEFLPLFTYLADFLINRKNLFVLSIERVGGSEKKRVLSESFKNPGELIADGDWVKTMG
jgi:hypothetical protein